jgi:CheY-like chemotaxis protein
MPASADLRRMCLIAESDPFIANLLLRFAEGSEIECVRVGVDDDVLELVRKIQPAVVIIDDELPGDLIGWEVIRAIKADAATRDIAVISCSWLSRRDMHSLVGELAGHLQKPDFRYDDFVRALRAAGIHAAERRTAGSPPFRSGEADTSSIDPHMPGGQA